MPFLPHTDAQRREMLEAIGLAAEDLFSDIPAALRDPPMDLPDGVPEARARDELERLGAANRPPVLNFLGGGFYDHDVPAAIDAILQRSEFFTAYTPYQPEISQGTLQVIYEWQSAVCRLTGMEVANASMYDGGTAIYEATMMASRVTRRHRFVCDDAVNPIYRRMLRTHLRHHGAELVVVPSKDGLADRTALAEALDDQTAALILQNPNYLGCLDDLADLADAAHEVGALVVASVAPVSLALVTPPGAMGVDIVTGEAQSLGLGLGFGGPYLGFMAARRKHVRKMPGRIVGRTVDTEGRPGFVLTLQAREQHIRREKASSNICTNQNLCALAALVYLSLLGKEGLRGVARGCRAAAVYARERLARVKGVELLWPERPVFNEFAVHLPEPAGPVVGRLLKRGIAAGIPLGPTWPMLESGLLVAVTEKRTRAEIDQLAGALEETL